MWEEEPNLFRINFGFFRTAEGEQTNKINILNIRVGAGLWA